MRFGVFSAGVPDRRTVDTMRSLASDIYRWDIIAPPDRFNDVLYSVESANLGGVHLTIAPIVPVGPSDAVVHHFVTAGFGVHNDPMFDHWQRIDTDGRFSRLMFRIPWTDPIGGGVTRARELAESSGSQAVVIVELPRGSESAAFDDDEVVAGRVAETARAAASEPDVDVFLDGFTDHDRGYYPRHGLIDRSFNPRTALYRLIEVASGRG